ncbi:Regulator of Chromosome Condensation (RCC1) repeat protein [Bradymonas sediminis]|nr:Regulator of Chromosome Condensation (RCC1) repeat protein [Bradymonas sediminis]
MMLPGCALVDALSGNSSGADEDVISETDATSEDVSSVDVSSGDVDEPDSGWGGCAEDFYVVADEAEPAGARCAPCPDGTVNKDPYASECVVPLKSVSAGRDRGCGILRMTEAHYCWGNVSDPTPLSFDDSRKFHSIDIGEFGICGIREATRRVICEPNSLENVPLEVIGVRVESVSVGFNHACAIREEDSRVICWGNNDYGQRDEIPTETRFKSISAGDSHTCGIDEEGYVHCWGDLLGGEYSGEPTGNRYEIPPSDKFRAVSVGFSYACGILEADAKVKCWGVPQGGSNMSPPEIAATSLSVGRYHACATPTADDQGVVCWGDGGDDLVLNSPAGGEFRSVSVGFNLACAIREFDNKVSCWGSDYAGQVRDAP